MNFESSTLAISQADPVVNPTSYDAVDFAYRISKLSTFLSAAHELILVLSGTKYVTTRKVCPSSFFYCLKVF